MRGAPQLGFSATIRKIRARASLLTRFRPPTCLALETHVQYKRNPARCQLTTVLGVTKTRGFVLSFAKIGTTSEINSLHTFLKRLICYKSPPCCSLSGSGWEPSFASSVYDR